jgi:Kef-type K+ transport system membrane component KefB
MASNVSCGASSLDDAIEDEANEFHHILWIVFFITLVWVTGKCFHRIGCPALVGEIVVGGLLGPNFANVVPEHHALVLYGEVGLMLLVIEAGLDVDLEMLRLLGLRGLGVAISGSLAPLAIATALSIGVLGLSWRSALAVGCTLAPTSMGVALNVLKRGKVLNTPTGQLVISAAVLDDIIALILLSELQALDDASAMSLLRPIVSSVGLLALGLWLGVQVVPGLMRRLKPRIPPKRLPKVLLGMLMLLAMILVPLCHELGSSPLLGAFLSGLSFCTDRDVHDSWARQVKRLMQWLLRIFFAATIAFAVPINEFASLEVLKGAAILSVAVLGKIATGLWAMPLNWGQFWTVGLAMSAWGEFAFVVATTARSAGLLDQRAFASVILAVVLSILVSPVLLRLVINRNHRTAVALIEGASARSRASLATGAKSLGAGSAAVPVHFQLRTVSAPTWGLNGRLFEALSAEKLIILDFRSQHDEERRQVTNELVAGAFRACARAHANSHHGALPSFPTGDQRALRRRSKRASPGDAAVR